MNAEAGETATARTGTDGLRTDIRVGSHRLIADEPLSAGGTDLGPSPYGLLSSALASCTAMTLQMYAEFKKLDLESVTVSVTHNRIHARDCEDCETTSGRIDEFHRVISLAGELTEAQRQRMLEIADKCPVHRTLTGETRIRTERGDLAA